jgi:hypothetical protein
MASGHVNRAHRPNTWLHRPARYVKKVVCTENLIRVDEAEESPKLTE